MSAPRALWRRIINPRLTNRPWRLFEFLDFYSVPEFIRRRCHAILTAAWIHKVPMVQRASPAEIAANVIAKTLDDMGEADGSKISVVEFCSGAGGPTPTMERIVNGKRAEQGRKPIHFIMSDLHPDSDSWTEVCKGRQSLSFIPHSVDATDPPASVTSLSAPSARKTAASKAGARIFRLYCLSFHHFDDETAKKVLRSTMETADGFAIIELQDRYLSSICLMLGHVPLIYLTSIFRYWRDLGMLFLVYVIPIAPVINTWDGIVSCLRTRTFKEVMSLVEATVIKEGRSPASDSKSMAIRTAERDGWTFKSAYKMHSWPVGYMSYITGYRDSSRRSGEKA